MYGTLIQINKHKVFLCPGKMSEKTFGIRTAWLNQFMKILANFFLFEIENRGIKDG